MKEMHKGMVNSPLTELKESISAQSTVIKVNNINAFPQGPNLAVIGTDENAETIYYATKTTNALSGCQRGVEGLAKTWNAGEKIARNFTNKDHADLIDNLKELNESKATKQSVNELKSILETKADWSELSEKLGKTEKASDSQRLGGYDSSHFVTNKKLTDLVVDNLTTDDRTKAISAKQGKILKESVDSALQRAEQAFQSANNAKNQLVEAIIGIGGSASTSESFSELIKQYKERTEYTIITQPKIPILQVGDNRSLTRKYFIFDKVFRVEDGRTLLLFRLPARMENRLKSYEKMTVRLELGEASSNFNRVRIYMTYENGDAIKEIAEVTRSDFDEGGLSCTKEIYAPFAGPLVQSATNYRIAVEVEGVMRSVSDAIEAETRLLGNDVYEFRIWFS